MYWDNYGVGYFFPPPEPQKEEETQAYRDFVAYHEQNPKIWDKFESLTRELIGLGWKRIGADLIFRIIRWQTMISGESGPWKIDHNHFPFYSREFMKRYPEYEGIFEIRRLTRK